MVKCLDDIQLLCSQIDAAESFCELDLALNRIYEAYKTCMYRGKITQYLFSVFPRQSYDRQYLMLKYLRRMKEDVQTVPLDIEQMLMSNSLQERRLGRKIVYDFWGLFEYDEAIVHLIHKRKRFRAYLAGNEKYRRFYKIEPIPQPARMKTAGPTTKSDFLARLEAVKHSIIYRYFYKKIEELGKLKKGGESTFKPEKDEIGSEDLNSGEMLIPGIDDDDDCPLEFELELSGLKSSRVFSDFEDLYQRLI